jgi:hypothetical protein
MSTELTVLERAKQALRSTDHEPALVELAKQAADITAIKNADGRTQVHGAYMTLKTRRTDIRKAGKDARDDATKFSQSVIAEEDRLIGIIEPEERRLKALRDGYDADREAERVAKAQAEQRRVDTIRAMIDDMRSIPVGLVDASAEKIAGALDDLDMFEVTSAAFDEFVDTAHLTRTDVLAKLRDMHAAAVRRAEEAAQLAAERAALAKQRAEQEERERVAVADRQRVDAIKATITSISQSPGMAIGAPIERVSAVIERIAKCMAESDFAEFADEAAATAASAVAQLTNIRETMIAQQKAAEELAAQQIEIAHQQAAIDAERQRIADEEAARLRAEEDAAKPISITIVPAEMERLIDALDAPAAPNAELTRAMSSFRGSPATDAAEQRAREAADTAVRNAAPAMLEALDKLVEAADASDDAHYGTLSTSFVRDIANAAIVLARQTEAQEVAA